MTYYRKRGFVSSGEAKSDFISFLALINLCMFFFFLISFNGMPILTFMLVIPCFLMFVKLIKESYIFFFQSYLVGGIVGSRRYIDDLSEVDWITLFFIYFPSLVGYLLALLCTLFLLESFTGFLAGIILILGSFITVFLSRI